MKGNPTGKRNRPRARNAPRSVLAFCPSGNPSETISITSAETKGHGESSVAKKAPERLDSGVRIPSGLRLAILVALELDTLVVLMLRHLGAAFFLNGTHVGYSLR